MSVFSEVYRTAHLLKANARHDSGSKTTFPGSMAVVHQGDKGHVQDSGDEIGSFKWPKNPTRVFVEAANVIRNSDSPSVYYPNQHDFPGQEL